MQEKNKNKIDHKIKTKPVQVRPFVYKTPSISDITTKMLILLCVQVVMLGIAKSYEALIVVCSSLIAAVLAAVLSYLVTRKKPYTNISVVVQGLLIGMLLPQSFPPVTVFLITFIVLFMSRLVFYNTINAWLNIVCLAVIVAWFIGRKYFPDFLVTSDILTLKNPSALLIQNGVFPVYDFDSTITNFLNTTIFAPLKVHLPEGFISLLCDAGYSIPAFRFNLLTLITSIILFADESFSALIPGFFLVTYGLLVRIFFPFILGGAINTGDVILAMCSSGTLFCSVFLIQWFGTHPITIWGKIVYGFIAGILAFVIVGCGTSPIGMIYTVLICNVVNLMIVVVEEKRKEIFVSKLVAENLK